MELRVRACGLPRPVRSRGSGSRPRIARPADTAAPGRRSARNPPQARRSERERPIRNSAADLPNGLETGPPRRPHLVARASKGQRFRASRRRRAFERLEAVARPANALLRGVFRHAHVERQEPDLGDVRRLYVAAGLAQPRHPPTGARVCCDLPAEPEHAQPSSVLQRAARRRPGRIVSQCSKRFRSALIRPWDFSPMRPGQRAVARPASASSPGQLVSVSPGRDVPRIWRLRAFDRAFSQFARARTRWHKMPAKPRRGGVPPRSPAGAGSLAPRSARRRRGHPHAPPSA